MNDNVNHDQAAFLRRSLILVCTVFSDLSVQIQDFMVYKYTVFYAISKIFGEKYFDIVVS